MNNTLNETSKAGKSGRWKLWLSLLLVVAAAVAMVAIPVFVIMPFKAQTAAALSGLTGCAAGRRRLRWLRFSPFLALCAGLWRGSRWRGRLAMMALLAPLLAVTWFARQNHFEWMFNPLPNPDYARVARSRLRRRRRHGHGRRNQRRRGRLSSAPDGLSSCC